jgi:hypothetical protein
LPESEFFTCSFKGGTIARELRFKSIDLRALYKVALNRRRKKERQHKEDGSNCKGSARSLIAIEV